MEQQQEKMDAMLRAFQEMKARVEEKVDVCEYADLQASTGPT